MSDVAIVENNVVKIPREKIVTWLDTVATKGRMRISDRAL